MTALKIPAPKGNRDHWYSLQGSGRALAAFEAAQSFNGLTLFITDSARSAQAHEIALDFFKKSPESLPVLNFPDWETLPYDLFSPHQDIISERLRVLYNLSGIDKGILVIPITTLMHRLVPAAFVKSTGFSWKQGQKLDIQALRNQLQEAGYQQVETVYDHGEYAIRGAIVDVFPMGSDQPIRLDLFDDEIESLRIFDTETQLTDHQLEQIELLPAKEIDLSTPGIKRFKDNWHLAFDADPKKSNLYQDVARGIASQGIEYYLPLFFEQTATLFDYLPNQCQLLLDGELEKTASQFWQEISARFSEHNIDSRRPLLPPGELFIDVPETFAQLGKYRQVHLHGHEAIRPGGYDFHIAKAPLVGVDLHNRQPLAHLLRFVADSKHRILFCAESQGRREMLEELLRKEHLVPTRFDGWQDFLDGEDKLGITVHEIATGLSIPGLAITLITETELFGKQVLQSRRRTRARESTAQAFRDLAELHVGSPVVHLEHGVGRYRGLTTLTAGGVTQEFLNLEYGNGAQLYVPVSSLQLISRYSGAEEALAPLHNLGTDKWQKTREKALSRIRDTAAELLDVYARRANAKGNTVAVFESEYLRFCADFPFEETPDQMEAIEAVKADMSSPRPMDRLVCGDVGFGKTEVAMRAAYLAVAGGYQVLMLVPTTLLAQQHTENFRDRFSNWPVRIETLSRFQTQSEQNVILKDVANGKVDILIGTHKLLNSKLDLQKLGLLIIDEEHRFGVNQKEKIKALRSNVDFLTLTATPIPRTLNMSLQGLRDLSIIATPPPRRLSVKTFVREHEKRLVKEAILRELLRGGQVYYLHNDVKTIARTASELTELLPEARIAVGHGQMRERELEKVMSDFYHQRFNVLVCTTIIETGIDIPSANTIIIERADKFGLAQLHQLRGRVGRSHHQAYAYLITPHVKNLTADAVKRLEAIESADHLGSGFTLATQDMEIRGAGELLGEEQSGHIQAIGFSLYMDLLNRAVNALKQGKTIDDDLSFNLDNEVNLNIPALIPEDYLPDVHSRLVLYKRIAAAENEQQLKELQVEMIDRFGLLPEAVKNLFRVTELKFEATARGINKIDVGPLGGKLEFSAKTTIEPIQIIKLVQGAPDKYRLDGGTALKFSATTPLETVEQRFEAVQTLLDNLTSDT